MTVVRWLQAGSSRTLTSAPAWTIGPRYSEIAVMGATWSRRELVHTNRHPSSGPKSGHCTPAHASSSRASVHPPATWARRSDSIFHRPRAMLPPVLNTPQRSWGISRPTQL
jgi:hypothetical protein